MLALLASFPGRSIINNRSGTAKAQGSSTAHLTRSILTIEPTDSYQQQHDMSFRWPGLHDEPVPIKRTKPYGTKVDEQLRDEGRIGRNRAARYDDGATQQHEVPQALRPGRKPLQSSAQAAPYSSRAPDRGMPIRPELQQPPEALPHEPKLRDRHARAQDNVIPAGTSVAFPDPVHYQSMPCTGHERANRNKRDQADYRYMPQPLEHSSRRRPKDARSDDDYEERGRQEILVPIMQKLMSRTRIYLDANQYHKHAQRHLEYLHLHQSLAKDELSHVLADAQRSERCMNEEELEDFQAAKHALEQGGYGHR